LPNVDTYVVEYFNNIKMFTQASKATLPAKIALEIASASSTITPRTPTQTHPTQTYAYPEFEQQDFSYGLLNYRYLRRGNS
jgi:hypothetical protein